MSQYTPARLCPYARGRGWLLAILALAFEAEALDLQGFLEDFDFNDYAAGVSAAVTQQPYRGVGHTQTFYPYLTSVDDSTMTDSAFIARNGTYGWRSVWDSGLELGVLTRLEVLGFGADPGEPLDQLDPPQWTAELGPSIGWRRGMVQPDLTLRKGVWGGHDGWVGEFSLSVPVRLSRGFVVPYAALAYRGSEYLEHYFGVRPRPGAAPELPAYEPASSATSYRLGVRAGYRLSKQWVLTGSAGLDFLDDRITDSPLVTRDTLGAMTLGIAYNRSIFVEQNPDWRGELEQPRVSLSVYGVAGTTSTDLVLRRPVTSALAQDLDELLPLDRDPDFLRADFVWRIGSKHRLELSYAEIERTRKLAATDGVDGRSALRLGQTSRFARAAYGYSLINTRQKELGLLLGLHWPRLTATVRGEDGDTLREIDAASPLFSLGAYGRVAIRHGFSLGARLEAGGLQVGQYEGGVFDARGVLSWEPVDNLALLVGYSWQFTRLDGYSDGFAGRFTQRTRGPLLGLQLRY